MALTSELAATPAVTVRVSLGDQAEINEARDWVEYLNGDAGMYLFVIQNKTQDFLIHISS